MKLIHIVGRKNHGKTTLMVELIRELTRRGVSVGTIKHSSHVHELDTPGKDSYLHRQAGANPAAVVAQNLIGLFLPHSAELTPYATLAPMFAECALVLVEGDIDGPGDKIEVWRRAVGGPCLALDRRDIAAVVTDDPLELDIPIWPRREVAALSEHLLCRL